jgi:exopolyphosphatase/guanosine-5'-triphosphate,3'-diphosphate pyrophosphatase
MRRVAAIDLGTNTTLMLVSEVGAANALVRLEDRATITRLGRGVDRTGRLDSVAVDGTLQALQEYRRCADTWFAEIVAVGTSALRDAENRDDFLLPAQSILGVAVEVVAGEREAGLTFCGALEGRAAGADNLMGVDIGGGSTEFVLGKGNSIEHRVSVNLGSVRMHERCALAAPAGPRQVAALRAEIA